MIIKYNIFMENKETDIFELSNKRYNSTNLSGLTDEENPFMRFSSKQDPLNRINDYDYNILPNEAYKDISNDVFKLEYKIAKTEEQIKNIEAQINTANEINDYAKASELKNKLDSLKRNYDELLAIYNDRTLSAKITDSVSGFVQKAAGANISEMKSSTLKILDLVVSKLPAKIAGLLKIRKSLVLLENINKNVDELVNMTIPYGENIDKYRQLSKYIIKANSIQSEIAGILGKKV